MILNHSKFIINVGQMIKVTVAKQKELKLWGYNLKSPLGRDRINPHEDLTAWKQMWYIYHQHWSKNKIIMLIQNANFDSILSMGKQ
jgi:hypothetical protein